MKTFAAVFCRVTVWFFTVLLFICFATWISGCDTIDEVAPESKGIVCGDLRLSIQHPEGAYLLCIVSVLQEEIERLEADLDASQESLGACSGLLTTCLSSTPPDPIICPVCVADTCDHDHKDKSCKNKK